MITFLKKAAEVWRDYQTQGDPGSGLHEPQKPEIREWGKTVEDGVETATADADEAAIGNTHNRIRLAHVRAAQMAAAAPFQR